MANDCTFDAVVRGPKEEIDIFYKRCLKAQENGKKTHSWWTYEVLKEHGYSTYAIEHKIGFIGGHLDNLGEPIKDGDEYFLTINMTTRWSPMITAFDRMLGNYTTLKAVYFAEEPGMGVYVNTDKSGRDFRVEYCIEDYDEDGCGSEYFGSDEELIKFIKDVYGKDIKSIPPDDDAEIRINKAKRILFHRFAKHYY